MKLIASYKINLVCFCLILSVIIKLITVDNSVVSTNFTNWINCQISTGTKSFSIFSPRSPPVTPPSPTDHCSDSIQLWPSWFRIVKRLSQPPLSPLSVYWRGQSCFGRWRWPRKSQSPCRDLRAWNCSRCSGGKKCRVWQTSMRWLKMWGGNLELCSALIIAHWRI